MVGDSLMANNPWYKYPRSGWGEQLYDYLGTDSVKVFNYSHDGASTRSFRNGNRWNKVVRKAQKNNIVVIGFSHNDEIHLKPTIGVPVDEFKKNLEDFIIEVKQKQSIVILCTPIKRRIFENGQLQDIHAGYPQIIRDVARKHEVILLDFHAYATELINKLGEEESQKLYLILQAGHYRNFIEGTFDTTHLSVYGARHYAQYAAGTIKKILDELMSTNPAN